MDGTTEREMEPATGHPGRCLAESTRALPEEGQLLRFKHFFGSPPEIETQVNEWLAEYEPDVTQMTQTTGSDGRVAISFLFEESFRGQERRMGHERGIVDTGPAMPARDIPDKPLELPSDPIGSP